MTADARASTGLNPQGSFAGASSSFLGYAVAVDQDTAVVGAVNDNGGKGAAYVYFRDSSGWTEQQVLTAGTSGAVGDEFGYSVAVSGNLAVVGTVATPRALVFARSGSQWSLQGSLQDPDPNPVPADCFGCAVALRGTTAIVGAPGKLGGNGEVYVFSSSRGGWQLQQSFSGQTNEVFGFSVALSPDGSTGLVGAYGAANEKGQAYLLMSSGNVWSQSQSPLVASDGAAHDRFGYSVALSDDTALVGAYANGGHGAAYLFSQSSGVWSSIAPKLVASDAAAADAFGISVALGRNLALIGAYGKSGASGPGAAYAFSNTGGTWALQSQQELVAPTPGQYFGYVVAMSGATAVVGAFGASDGSGASDAGAVYMFGASPVPALGGSAGLLALVVALGAWGVRSRRSQFGVGIS